MQPELLPIPPSDETDEALKVRIDRLYRIYGQDWRPFFEQHEATFTGENEPDPLPWWLLRRARQFAGKDLSPR